MSQLQVDTILNATGEGAPDFPNGVVVTGVITATTLNQNVTGILTATSLSLSGDITGVDNLSLSGDINATGVITATSFKGDGANLTNLPVTGGVVSGISSGSISIGSPTCVYSDGKFAAVTGTAGSKATTTPLIVNTTDDGYGLEFMSLVYDPVNDQYILVYHSSSGSPTNWIYAKVGTVSGTTITWGSAQTISGGNSDYPQALWDTVNNKLIVMYRATSDSNKGKCRVCTVSGTTITAGAESASFTGGAELQRQAFVHDPVQDKIVFVWEQSNTGYSIVGEVDAGANTISFPGSTAEYCGTRAFVPVCSFHPGQNKVVVGFMHYSNAEKGAIVAGTVSGNSITWGTLQYYEELYMSSNTLTYDSTSSRMIIGWVCGSSGSYVPKVRTATLSGTTWTFATTSLILGPTGVSAAGEVPSLCYDLNSNKSLFVWRDTGNGASQLFSAALTVNPTTGNITQSTAYQFTSGQTIQIISTDAGKNLVLDPDNNLIVNTWKDTGSNPTPGIKYYVERIGSSNMSADNLLGFSQAGYTNGQTAKVDVVGAVNASQSGLSTGSKYYVRGDGSLSITADDPSVSAGLALSGTEILIR
tara:strand:+ start:334 stop:2097 length:1764 start_codon:yes stop_codon:yes gene_type:complete